MTLTILFRRFSKMRRREGRSNKRLFIEVGKIMLVMRFPEGSGRGLWLPSSMAKLLSLSSAGRCGISGMIPDSELKLSATRTKRRWIGWLQSVDISRPTRITRGFSRMLNPQCGNLGASTQLSLIGQPLRQRMPALRHSGFYRPLWVGLVTFLFSMTPLISGMRFSLRRCGIVSFRHLKINGFPV